MQATAEALHCVSLFSHSWGAERRLSRGSEDGRTVVDGVANQFFFSLFLLTFWRCLLLLWARSWDLLWILNIFHPSSQVIGEVCGPVVSAFEQAHQVEDCLLPRSYRTETPLFIPTDETDLCFSYFPYLFSVWTNKWTLMFSVCVCLVSQITSPENSPAVGYHLSEIIFSEGTFPSSFLGTRGVKRLCSVIIAKQTGWCHSPNWRDFNGIHSHRISLYAPTNFVDKTGTSKYELVKPFIWDFVP